MCCRNPPPQNLSVLRLDAIPEKLENGITLKVVTVGSYAIGKTQLIRVLIREKFSADNVATVGVGLFMGRLNAEDEPIKYQALFWDTAGQERYDSMSTGYYRDADVVLICHDLGEAEPTQVQRYIEKVATCCTKSPKVFIIGTKKDIANPNRANTENKFGFEVYEVSAQTGAGIEQLRDALLLVAKERHRLLKGLISLEATSLRDAQRIQRK
jgi:small GTP-binding protein